MSREKDFAELLESIFVSRGTDLHWLFSSKLTVFSAVLNMLCTGVLWHTACEDILKHRLIWH